MSEAPTYLARPFHNPRQEFPRDNNSFINLEAYKPYLIDSSDEAPIIMTSRDRTLGWVYQHAYFQKTFYSQKGIDEWKRDWVLSEFCTTPYNLIAMRSFAEQELHSVYEEHVIAPDPESMQKALLDFYKLDIVGAAAIGRRVSLVPEALEYLSPGAGNARVSTVASPKERADYFDKVLESTLEQLNSYIIPEQVLVGAIKRLAKLFHAEVLEEEAQNLLPSGEVYIPVGVRNPSAYYQLSLDLLKNVSLMEDNNARFRAPGKMALLTEVNGVELVAA